MKLLIADDEVYAREGILSILPLEELGIHQVMETHDGKAALDVARWFAPDLVITDICMPRMTGMDFAAALKKLMPDCQLIFITGFSEINYLKQAIELSAVAFVEKPIQTDELLKAVRAAVQRRQSLREARQHTENLNQLRRQRLAMILNRNDKEPEEIRSRCRQIGFPLQAEYCCMALRLPPHYSDVYDTVEQLEAVCQEHGFDCVIEPREDRMLMAVLAGRRTNGAALDGLIRVLLQRMIGVRIGVGMSVNVLERICDSRKAAKTMLDRSFFAPEVQVFRYAHGTSMDAVLDMDAYAQFIRLLESGEDRLSAWMETLFSSLSQSMNAKVENVRALLLSMLREIYRRSPQLYGKVMGISREWELETYVNSVQTLEELREFMNQLLEAKDAQAATTSRFAPVIHSTRVYIAEHFREPDLSLDQIAAQVNFTPAYLNVVFRQEVGKTVKQYIIDYRLEEACLLLRDPHVRITEIAGLCGYSNANYFSKAFKDAKGMTPGEYRESMI